MGIQIAMGVFVAALLKWNKIAAAIGVQVTNPLTAPFIYSVTYVISAKLIGLKETFIWADAFDLSKLIDMLEKAPAIFAALTIGGIVIGSPVSIIGYFVSYAVIEKYQDDIKEKLSAQKDKIRQKIRSRRAK